MEPRFNEVPRDWGRWFVISRIRYIENLDIKNLRKKQMKCSLCQGSVLYVLKRQRWRKPFSVYTEDFVIQRFIKSSFHCISNYSFLTSSLSEKIKQVFETNVKCKTIKIEHFRPICQPPLSYQSDKCMYCRYRLKIFVVARNLSYSTLDFSF